MYAYKKKLHGRPTLNMRRLPKTMPETPHFAPPAHKCWRHDLPTAGTPHWRPLAAATRLWSHSQPTLGGPKLISNGRGGASKLAPRCVASVAHTEAGKFWERRFRGRILRENRETLRFASRIYMRVAYMPVAIAQWAASGACPPRQNQILFSALLNWSHPHSDTSFVVFGTVQKFFREPQFLRKSYPCLKNFREKKPKKNFGQGSGIFYRDSAWLAGWLAGCRPEQAKPG